MTRNHREAENLSGIMRLRIEETYEGQVSQRGERGNAARDGGRAVQFPPWEKQIWRSQTSDGAFAVVLSLSKFFRERDGMNEKRARNANEHQMTKNDNRRRRCFHSVLGGPSFVAIIQLLLHNNRS